MPTSRSCYSSASNHMTPSQFHQFTAFAEKSSPASDVYGLVATQRLTRCLILFMSPPAVRSLLHQESSCNMKTSHGRRHTFAWVSTCPSPLQAPVWHAGLIIHSLQWRCVWKTRGLHVTVKRPLVKITWKICYGRGNECNKGYNINNTF